MVHMKKRTYTPKENNVEKLKLFLNKIENVKQHKLGKDIRINVVGRPN